MEARRGRRWSAVLRARVRERVGQSAAVRGKWCRAAPHKPERGPAQRASDRPQVLLIIGSGYRLMLHLGDEDALKAFLERTLEPMCAPSASLDISSAVFRTISELRHFRRFLYQIICIICARSADSACL